jgi:SagB-type dehydrogenase family enzyme
MTADASSELLTVSDASAVYGDGAVSLDDPAEAYHEASKLYPSMAARQVSGSIRLAASPELQVSARRAVKRHVNRPALPLPPPIEPTARFTEIMHARRSERRFGADPITLAELATVLNAGYGVTAGGAGEQALRTVPSGGALYPLELYAVLARVEGIEAGLYHLDPMRSALEALRRGSSTLESLVAASIYPEIVETAAVTLIVTGMFWRSRFKYGLRGYRFALLEAGHLAQNILLSCTALELAATPLGGFYDRAVDELLGIDGVNESILYLVCLGRRDAP